MILVCRTASVLLLLLPALGFCWPLDGYPATGIRRLEQGRMIQAGELPGRKQPLGATKSDSAIHLRLQGLDISDSVLFRRDPVLQRQIEGLFRNLDKNYSLSLLVLEPGKTPRYAAWRDEVHYQPGSVGKLAVAAGTYAELARRFPADTAARRNLLKTRMISAGPWIHVDTRTMPYFDPVKKKGEQRRLRMGDTFSLYEWLDHMASPSSNAAASMVWKEMLMARMLGPSWPCDQSTEKTFWDTVRTRALVDSAYPLVNAPLRAVDIDSNDFQLGAFFTNYGQRKVPTIGTWADTRSLLTYLVRMEEGRIVDPWSSLEIKKLLYTTWRRIRYGTAGVLKPCALYFKSGSLYKCRKEEGYTCKKYEGNEDNYMNSVAVVETPDGTVYWVALMSNVLKKNSDKDHAALAARIHAIVTGGK